MIPFGNIRIKKYSNKPSSCSSFIPESLSCTNSTCTYNTLLNIYSKSKCGYPHSSSLSLKEKSNHSDNSFLPKLIKPFEGEYSVYNLVNDGVNYDFNINTYESNKESIINFIRDPNLKFIALQFNFYSPLEDDYLFVIAGIEMLNYFTHTYKVFSSTVYFKFNFKDPKFMAVYCLFSISVSLIIILFIYELNTKSSPIEHFLTFLNEVSNLILIVFVAFYFYACEEETFYQDGYAKQEFHQHMVSLSIQNECLLIISILFIFLPFRFISCISTFKTASKEFLIVIRTIFRTLPGIAIYGILLSVLVVTCAFANYLLFNTQIFEISKIFYSIVSFFNFNIIKEVNDVSYQWNNNISQNKYYILFLICQMMLIVFTSAMFIAILSYLIEQAVAIEKNEKKETLIKLEELHQKIMLNEDDYDPNMELKNMNSGVLWLCLGKYNDNNDKDDYEYFANKYKESFRYFTNAEQLISYLKNMFAIKPALQHINLTEKMQIVVHSITLSRVISVEEYEEIAYVLKWLETAGCDIDIYFYTRVRLCREVRMKLSSLYLSLKFTTNKEDLALVLWKELENEKKMNCEKNKSLIRKFAICNEINLTLYPYIYYINDNEYDNSVNENNTQNLNVSFNNNSNVKKSYKRLHSNVSNKYYNDINTHSQSNKTLLKSDMFLNKTL
jgi:hypothetical protein